MYSNIKFKSNGFTLIEVMVIVAIIGILAVIALTNFMRYRDKTYCTAAETDGQSTAAAVSDYYAIPAHHNVVVSWNDLNLSTSNGNVVSIGGTVDNLIISVTDATGRCPASYTANMTNWNGSVYTINIQ